MNGHRCCTVVQRGITPYSLVRRGPTGAACAQTRPPGRDAEHVETDPGSGPAANIPSLPFRLPVATSVRRPQMGYSRRLTTPSPPTMNPLPLHRELKLARVVDVKKYSVMQISPSTYCPSYVLRVVPVLAPVFVYEVRPVTPESDADVGTEATDRRVMVYDSSSFQWTGSEFKEGSLADYKSVKCLLVCRCMARRRRCQLVADGAGGPGEIVGREPTVGELAHRVGDVDVERLVVLDTRVLYRSHRDGLRALAGAEPQRGVVVPDVVFAADSGPSRSPIPAQADHSFRFKPITDSGRTRSAIPVPSRSFFGGDRNRSGRPV